MRTSLLPLTVLAALALAPAAASAATITGGPGGTYTYTAAAGEINNISVQGDDAGSVTFYGPDAVTVSSAPAACQPSSLYGWSVTTCASATAIVVAAGDGDEVLSISSTVLRSIPVTIDGGAGKDIIEGDAGNDTLLGGSGDDKLSGGKGADALDGGDGNDVVAGGDGADRLAGGTGDDTLEPDSHEDPSADVVDGGPGIDTITGDYSSRFRDSDLPVGLSFTMAGGADDGRPGENDDLEGVERLILSESPRYAGTEGADYVKVAQSTNAGELIGNGGDDDLNGADGAEKLDGGPGNDHLDGGFGDDTIVGGPGQDRISGDLAGGDCGPLWCKYPYGNDTIYAQDGEVDSILCGAGTDAVFADAADVVDRDCETVTRGAAAPAGPAPGTPGAKSTTKGGGVKATVIGRATLAKALKSGIRLKLTGVKAGTTVRLTATRTGKVVARGSAKATKKGTATVTLRFTAKARRSLRHAKSVTLKIGGGASTTLTLKRR